MFTPDEIIRSNRKTLSILVDGQGRLIVRAPQKCADERIFAFLKEKEGWIAKKRAERQKNAIPLPSANVEGYVFLLLGEQTKIRIVAGGKIGYDAKKHVVYLPEEKSQERLKKWLKENAKRILENVTLQWAAKMNTSYSSLTITSARTRWGTCSGTDALRYTFRLLYCPREIIEYVVVHELAHTRHKNHSPAFWGEVAKYIPDWKARRKWLKDHGGLMDVF